jgi:hypothetical protein
VLKGTLSDPVNRLPMEGVAERQFVRIEQRSARSRDSNRQCHCGNRLEAQSGVLQRPRIPASREGKWEGHQVANTQDVERKQMQLRSFAAATVLVTGIPGKSIYVMAVALVPFKGFLASRFVR